MRSRPSFPPPANSLPPATDGCASAALTRSVRGQQELVELRSRGRAWTRAAEVFGDLFGQQPQLDVGFLGQPFEQVERGTLRRCRRSASTCPWPARCRRGYSAISANLAVTRSSLLLVGQRRDVDIEPVCSDHGTVVVAELITDHDDVAHIVRRCR